MSEFIFDLDGVLAESLSRQHLADSRDWDAFHKAGLDADVLAQGFNLLNICKLSCRIIIITGRNERYRNGTVEWLHRNGIHFDELHMRKDRDYIPSPEMKMHIILQNPWWEINCAFDDRKDIVEHFNKCGVEAVQVDFECKELHQLNKKFNERKLNHA